MKKLFVRILVLTALSLVFFASASFAAVFAQTLTPTDTPMLTPTDTPTLMPTNTPMLTPTLTPALTPTSGPISTLTSTPAPTSMSTPTLNPLLSPVAKGISPTGVLGQNSQSGLTTSAIDGILPTGGDVLSANTAKKPDTGFQIFSMALGVVFIVICVILTIRIVKKGELVQNEEE